MGQLLHMRYLRHDVLRAFGYLGRFELRHLLQLLLPLQHLSFSDLLLFESYRFVVEIIVLRIGRSFLGH